MARLAADLASVSRGDHVVDVGCGPGTAAREAARRRHASPGRSGHRDAPAGPGLVTRDRAAIDWAEGTAERLPQPDASATVVWSLATVHHWKDVTAGLAEARRSHSSQAAAEPDHGLGRSRGGLTTKVHALVDSGVHPVVVQLSPGQAGDNPRLVPLLDALADIGHRPAIARDRTPGAPRHAARAAPPGWTANIPERRDQVEHRKAKGSSRGRPPTFDPGATRAQHRRAGFGRFKQWRGIATRYTSTPARTSAVSSSPPSSSSPARVRRHA